MDSQWRKSTRSGSNGACVEARSAGCLAQVRDSKESAGVVLSFSSSAWNAFLSDLKCETGCIRFADAQRKQDQAQPQ
ncbi:DUF397 domain-containing protein [Micromonospora chokoriensis]